MKKKVIFLKFVRECTNFRRPALITVEGSFPESVHISMSTVSLTVPPPPYYSLLFLLLQPLYFREKSPKQHDCFQEQLDNFL